MNFSFLISFASLPKLLRQKVIFLWFARMVLHSGVVLLSTLLLALFIASYGERLLPILLLLQAIFLFLGSLASLPSLRKFSIRTLLIIWIILSGTLLLFSLLFSNLLITWGILAFCLSFFLWHALVFFALYIEEIFSPEEAKITIPLIESGEPIGGIIAGLLAALGAYLIDPSVLKFIGAFLLFLGAGLILISSFFIEEKVHLQNKEEIVEMEGSFFENLFEFCIIAFKTPLLHKLFWASIFQSIIFVLVEYQYLLSASSLFPAHSGNSLQSEIALQLTHGIGLFHVIVFTLLFIIQIFFAHHIQKKIGVIKSLLIQPFSLVINALGMILFAFIPLGMLGKGIYEVVGGIHKNAIASVFYAFKANIREESREFLEGIARPLGMIIGTLLIIGISFIIIFFEWSEETLLHILGGCVILSGGIYLWIMKKASKDYTRMAERNVKLPYVPEEKFDALEILSEKGHENPAWILSEVVKNKNEIPLVRILAFKGLSVHVEMEVFSDILLVLEESDEEEIQSEAMKTLLSYVKKNITFSTYPFSRKRIIIMLKKIFETAKSKRLRMRAIEVLSVLQYEEMIPFLSKKIHDPINDTAFCSILACGSFKDISIAPLLFPFLENENSYLKSATIIALWQFSRYKEILLSTIIEMLNSRNEDMQMSGVYAVGELQITSEISRLKIIANQNYDINLQKHAIIALAKMGDRNQIPAITSLLFHKNEEIASSTKKLITSPGVNIPFQEHLSSFIRQKVLEEIRELSNKNKNKNKLNKTEIERLIFLYKSINVEKMAVQLHHSLKNF